MNVLRASLMPPVLDDVVVADLARLVRRIEAEPHTRAALMQAFNDAVGHVVSELQFLTWSSWTTVEDFVAMQLTKQVPAVDDINDDEYLELIARLQRGDGNEVEQHHWLELLDRDFPEARIVDLVFRSALSPLAILRHAQRTTS